MSQFWIQRDDLRSALAGLSQVLELGLDGAALDALCLNPDIDATWYVGGSWRQVPTQSRRVRLALAVDECAGVFIALDCDEPEFLKARSYLWRFNELIAHAEWTGRYAPPDDWPWSDNPFG